MTPEDLALLLDGYMSQLQDLAMFGVGVLVGLGMMMIMVLSGMRA